MAKAVSAVVNVLESYRGRDRMVEKCLKSEKLKTSERQTAEMGSGREKSIRDTAVLYTDQLYRTLFSDNRSCVYNLDVIDNCLIGPTLTEPMRTLCYSCQLLGGAITQKHGEKQQCGKSLLIVASQLSHCRTVLRLFDDLSMLVYSLQYGLGKKEKDCLIRWISVLGNIFDQLYYPCEHMAWAADAGIIHIRSDNWWTTSTALWGLSLLVGIVRSLRALIKLRRSKGKLSEDDPPKSRGEVKFQMRSELLCVISSLSDLVNAIHWMPPGFLWGGCSPTWLVGLMGTISSVIGIYQAAVGGSSAGV